ncbi:MAG: AarF/ABC1/UbiB kinase family protein [Oscillospiraceae bacterium]|nr:AarF/ABC1/UbiB kinase family protein [Oscillospiraceae bacterium]
MGAEKPDKSKSRLGELLAALRRENGLAGLPPEKLRRILEQLGPAFIKLGQIASMHPDVLPEAYCRELSKLCTHVTPMPFEQVLQVIEQSCGRPWGQVFAQIEDTPLGSASIAQVNRARLFTGEQVVVKVQRQGIRETMVRDLQLMRKLIRWIPARLRREFTDLDQVWAVTEEEIDFLLEAANMEEFSRCNQTEPFIAVPRLYRDHTAPMVLVMEYIDGLAIDDTQALRNQGYDLRELGTRLADNYVRQIIEEGFFHADPHAGNIRVRGGKIVWLDMGMMGRLTQRDRSMLSMGVQGIALNDVSMIEEAVLTLGEFRQPPDRKKLRDGIDTLLKKYAHADMAELKLVEIMADLMEVMRENRIMMPHSLTLLVRGMTHMEGVLAELSPDINMAQIAKSQMERQLWDRDGLEQALKGGGRSLAASLRKLLDLPAYLSDGMKDFRNGDARMNIEVGAAGELPRLLGKLVQQAVEGLWVAALIIGASIVCTADLEPTVFGIPALAAVGYGLAAVSVVWKLIRRARRRRKGK